MERGLHFWGRAHRRRVGRFSTGAFAVLSTLGLAADALAHTVTVHPGAYDGQWAIPGGSFVTGSQTVNLPTGTSDLRVGAAGVLTVQVDASGVVTVPNAAAAVGGAGTLTLNTVTVDVDPAGYAGQWNVSRGEPGSFVAGPQTATLIPTLPFEIVPGGGGTFRIVADALGNVTVTNGVSAVGGQGTLTFNTVDVAVDPRAYIGRWGVVRGEPGGFVTGPQTATFIPAVPFEIVVGGAGSFRVTADAFQNVVVSNGVSAEGGLATLGFNTFGITIDPGTFVGTWNITGVGSSGTGVRSFDLVPAIPYQFVGSGLGAALFTVNSPCSTSPSALIIGGRTIATSCGCSDGDDDGVCDAVDACPQDPANDADGDGVCGDLDQCSGDDASGDADGDLVCDDIDPCFGNDLTGDVDGDGVCNDRDTCAGTDATGDADGDGVCDSDDLCSGDDATGDADGDFVCDDSDLCVGADALGDTDLDGVCDDSDVCPQDAANDADGDGVCGNLDRCLGDDSEGDTDGDGICDDRDACVGNDATGDFDGDDVCDDRDNCPLLVNVAQLDGDHDGIGDSCEADSDSDGVIDDVDNCTALANADQSDADQDGAGDPCDDDDDDDAVADAVDNCPLHVNPNQADGDADGAGDLCDGDDDADGVGDDVDACPGTPLSSLFDQDGCSGAQLVELACGLPQDGPHGRYVACVTRESKRAQRLGLITAAERAQMVRNAAHGNVGRPKNCR